MMMAIECRRGDMDAAMEVLDAWPLSSISLPLRGRH